PARRDALVRIEVAREQFRVEVRAAGGEPVGIAAEADAEEAGRPRVQHDAHRHEVLAVDARHDADRRVVVVVERGAHRRYPSASGAAARTAWRARSASAAKGRGPARRALK